MRNAKLRKQIDVPELPELTQENIDNLEDVTGTVNPSKVSFGGGGPEVLKDWTEVTANGNYNDMLVGVAGLSAGIPINGIEVEYELTSTTNIGDQWTLNLEISDDSSLAHARTTIDCSGGARANLIVMFNNNDGWDIGRSNGVIFLRSMVTDLGTVISASGQFSSTLFNNQFEGQENNQGVFTYSRKTGGNAKYPEIKLSAANGTIKYRVIRKI